MDRALSLARQAMGSTSPNPSVGSVVVKNGTIIGEGWTQPPGQAHAEIMALNQSGHGAAGGTLYTTLEPCSHIGKTSPCTQAIIEAGINKVVISILDPNPLVSGQGLSLLKEAGIKTYIGEGESEAHELMEGYLKFIVAKRPFVTAKFAISLDGKLATHRGDSKWITNEQSRDYVHQLRSNVDAIMVGINTVISDDPQLTARNTDGVPCTRQPLRVIVDSHGRTPSNAKLFSSPGDILIALAKTDTSNHKRLTNAGADTEFMPNQTSSVDLARLLDTLGDKNITSVLVEGGGTLLGSLFDVELVDKVVAFIAPKIIGGKMAPSPVAGKGVAHIINAMTLNRIKVMRFGMDVAIIGYREAKHNVHGNS